MRQIRRTGLVTVMVAGGAIAAAGAAHADSGAQGGAVGSPGVLSGNTVQIPVHVPVNVCGNTVNVVGLLNPAVGNSCENKSSGNRGNGGNGGSGGHAHSSDRNGGGAVAHGEGKDSPGLLSGNGIQLPVDVPVNVTGNSVNVVGIGNPSVGNSSSNTPAKPPVGPKPVTPPSPPRTEEVLPAHHEPQQLAETGASAGLGLTVPAGAALVLGGAVLYRRFRPAGHGAQMH
ncbi:chaplin [Streptomyces sp. NPDC057445]|uniref:chaplin n=1 Tax=Streptomyces sp. NPDC057445 TaxID=3346136 RepID=UPI0036BBD4E0